MKPPRRLDGSPEEGAERRWFAAGERCIAIDVPRRAPADDAATTTFRDALLLEEHAVLLDCLADCLGEPLDWRPAPPRDATFALTLASVDVDAQAVAPGPVDAEASADVDDRPADHVADADADGASAPRPRGEDTERRLALVLPSAARSSAGTLDVAAMRDAHAPWRDRVALLPHRLSTELVLDRLSLDENDVARCASGSVVLLPSSFDERWSVTLRAPSASASASACVPDSPDASPAARCDVVLEERFEIAAPTLDPYVGACRTGAPDAAGIATRDASSSVDRDGPSNEDPDHASDTSAHATIDVSLELDADALASVSDAAYAACLTPAGRRCRLRRADGGSAHGELIALGAGVALVLDEVRSWT